MSFKVTLHPSGHQFPSEPSETLLEAGLRAGLNLDHSCANGSCGECRARLINGDIRIVRHADFRFTEAERQQGQLLTCCCRAESDVEIEAHESGSAAEIPLQSVTAKVSRVEALQTDVMQLTVRTPRSGGLHFLAGQSASLEFDGQAPTLLSIASCPCDSVQLRFHLRRRPEDAFSRFAFAALRRGTELEVSGPSGDFTLDESSVRPLVFMAWESGFAPVSSLIDHAIQKDENRSIDLYWLSEIPRGHYLSNQCRAWRDVLDDFRYHSIDLEPAGTERIEDVIERVARVHGLLADHDYYLALPQAAIERALMSLHQSGVPRERVHTTLIAHP